MKSYKFYVLVCLVILVCFGIGLLIGRGRTQKYTGNEIEKGVEVVGVEKVKASKETSLILTGDIMLGRMVTVTSLDKEKDPRYPFLKVADVLRSADLVFSNLESPITEKCPRSTEGLRFCADSRMVEGLTFAGIDVVTLANNHALNYGEKGLTQTKELLEKNGIGVTASDAALTALDAVAGLSIAIKEIGGAKFGFVGFNLVDNKLTQKDLEDLVKFDNQVDVLIIGVHWGSEYTDKPNKIQRDWAAKMISSGADVIVGHHPHWAQPYEKIKTENGDRGGEGMVFWSLGNFVFDQPWSQKTREGLAVRLVYEGKDLKRIEELPVFMEKLAQPMFSVR